MRAEDVLARQAELLRGMSAPGHRAWLTEWLRRRGEAGETPPGEPTSGESFADAVAWGLRRSPAFLVTTEAIALVRRAAQDLPLDMAVAEHDLPSLHGFVLLEEELVVVDRYGDPIGISAISWSTGDAGFGEEVGVEELNGTAVVMWAQIGSANTYVPAALPGRGDAEAVRWMRKQMGCRYQAMHAIPVPLGLPLAQWRAFVAGEEMGVVAATFPVKVAIALWQLMRSPILTEERGRMSPKRRKAMRQERIPAQVSVYSLRRRPTTTGGGSEGDGTKPDWSHRWIVDGHWHRYRVGIGRRETRWRYVHPYVKGPEGKPLVVKERVRVVRAEPAEVDR